MNKLLKFYKIIILFIIFSSSVFAQNTLTTNKSQDIQLLSTEINTNQLHKIPIIIEFTDENQSDRVIDDTVLFSSKLNSVLNLMGRQLSIEKQSIIAFEKNF